MRVMYVRLRPYFQPNMFCSYLFLYSYISLLFFSGNSTASYNQKYNLCHGYYSLHREIRQIISFNVLKEFGSL